MIYDELCQMILGVIGIEVSQEQLFLETGIDSLEIIQLRNQIEYKYKVDLQMQQLMKMTFKEIADYIETAVMLGEVHKESDPISFQTERYFPLNDLQQAYWIGRTSEYELGNVSTHAYMEFEQDNLDIEKLEHALHKVIERQEMLRTVILEDGMQEVLSIEEAKYTVEYIDISEREEYEKLAILENERNRMSHQIFKLGHWPFFEMRIFKIDEKKSRINFGIDMLIADAYSIQIFFNNLKEFYFHPDIDLTMINFNFRDYVMKEHSMKNDLNYQLADQYWNERCIDIPSSPKIPLQKKPEDVMKPIFKHIGRKISPENYEKLKNIAFDKKVTVSVILLSIYAKVLARWSQEEDLSINVTYLDRKMYDEQINEIMGQFASFTIFPIKEIGKYNFYELTKIIQNDLWTDLDNRAVSGSKILQKIRKYNNDVSALMPIVFTCALEDISQTDWLGDIVYSISQTSQIWLDNQTFEDNGALMLFWDYIEELFPDGMISDMMDAYENAINMLANETEAWEKKDLDLIPKQYCNTRNQVNDRLIPKMPLDMIQESIVTHPYNVAVRSGDKTILYNELDEMTNKIANWICKKEEKNSVIGICMEKGWQQIVAVIGIAKAGCAYLPIDSNLPEERIAYMLKESEVKYVLSQEWLIHKYQNSAKKYNFSVLESLLQEEDDISQNKITIQEHDLIYIIYTSGSTGNPSGVMIEHIGLGNAIMSTNETYRIGEMDSIIAMTPLHHDMSVYDIFGILAAGGKIVIPDEKVRKEPSLLANLLLQERVSIWNSVPSLMDVFVDYIKGKPDKIPSFLRYVFLGGDWISIETCKKLFELLNNLTIISVGGPTETTMWNIWFPFTSVENKWGKIPYGLPIHNTQYYILNNMMQECPTWVPGKIYSSGFGIARGYQKDENKTKTRFVHHPITGDMLFDSGDLGYYLPDGNIEIVGRADNQIKINGIRIEIEEIELVLKQYPKVINAAVVFDNSTSVNRIIAFVAGEKKELINESITEYLQKKLPEYMLPKDIIIVPEILVSANHKVDRKKMLKDYVKQEIKEDETSTLDSSLEEEITSIIKEVLKVDSIGLDVKITDIGATSIELIKIINQLERIYNQRMELSDLFENLTIRKLVAYFRKKNDKGEEHANENNSQTFLSKYKVITDRMEREKFKISNQGLRRDLEDKETIILDLPEIDDELTNRFDLRRSFRHYDNRKIKLKDFSNFLYLLSNYDEKKYPNFLYASGGGLYSIQVYIHVKNDRIENLNSGLYYYNRNKHELKQMVNNIEIGRDIHWSSNQEIYEESAFSIYLVVDYDAVGPMYGERGLHFVTIEAGLISQLLEEHAHESNIGLCQIGNVDFNSVKQYLNLKESHIHVHTLLGGYIDYSGDYVSLQSQNNYFQYDYVDEQTVGIKEKLIKTMDVSELEQYIPFDESLEHQIDLLIKGKE